MIQLSLESSIQFGKYKDYGLTVATLLEKDPKYLLWLRSQRRNDLLQLKHNDPDLGMSRQVHELLDTVLICNPGLNSKNGYVTHLAKPTLEVTFPEEKEVSPVVPVRVLERWGSW